MTAKIPDISTIIQAGINPKTRLPYKLDPDNKGDLKDNMKRILRIVDEQDAVRRYQWVNLPTGLSGELIERILYYKGCGMFFYSNKTFYFLPFALSGEIDVYGFYKSVKPLPFGGTAKTDWGNAWITQMVRVVQRGILLENLSEDERDTRCVILYDYVRQLSQTIIPRQTLNDPLLDVMAEMIPFMRTNLITATGVKGMRVADADQESSVDIAAKQVEKSALTGKKWIPIVGPIEFQELGEGDAAKSEEFMLAMQSLDNFRLQTYGLDNGGLFEKKAHELQSENDMNSSNCSRTYKDGLIIRQEFCDIVNSIWGLGIYCVETNTQNNQSQMEEGEIDYGNDSAVRDDTDE